MELSLLEYYRNNISRSIGRIESYQKKARERLQNELRQKQQQQKQKQQQQHGGDRSFTKLIRKIKRTEKTVNQLPGFIAALEKIRGNLTVGYDHVNATYLMMTRGQGLKTPMSSDEIVEKMKEITIGLRKVLTDGVLSSSYPVLFSVPDGEWNEITKLFQNYLANVKRLHTELAGSGAGDVVESIKEQLEAQLNDGTALKDKMEALGKYYEERSQLLQQHLGFEIKDEDLGEAIFLPPDTVDYTYRVKHGVGAEMIKPLDTSLFKETIDHLLTGFGYLKDMGDDFLVGEEAELRVPTATEFLKESRTRTMGEFVAQRGQAGGKYAQMGTIALDDLRIIDDELTTKVTKDDGSMTFQPISGFDKEMIGRVGTETPVYDTLQQVAQKIFKLSLSHHELNESYKKFTNSFKKYQSLIQSWYFLICYLMMITSKHLIIPSQVFYRYLNVGTIQLYLRIIKKIKERIGKNDTEPVTVYFATYHSLLLDWLEKFLTGMREKLSVDLSDPSQRRIDQLIDLWKCQGGVAYGFMVLNHYKDILEAYNETYQGKVAIYARINDWEVNGAIVPVEESLFRVVPGQPEWLEIDREICRQVNPYTVDVPPMMKFTEVFGRQFSDSMAISKYMTLETRLTKKKGVMIITYGYSGVGKTHVLFGNKTGLFQSTLKNVRGIEKVKFRIYEIYGQGSQVVHNWQTPSRIKQNLYFYPTYHETRGGLQLSSDQPETHEGFTQILKFIRDDDSFMELSGANTIDQAFAGFPNTVERIDYIRRRDGRIMITPNNPESSRSILVYEFLLFVEDNWVPFLIVDLPGRENIIRSYVDSFLERDFVKDKVPALDSHYSWYRCLLSSLALNPIFAALLVPGLILESFNRLSQEERVDESGKNTGQSLRDYIYRSQIPVPSGPRRPSVMTNFLNEVITDYATTNTVKELVRFERDGRFMMVDNPGYVRNRHPGSYPRILSFKGFNYDRKTQVSKRVSLHQYQAVVCIHLINRILTLNQFDLMEKILDSIVEKMINRHLEPYFEELKVDQATGRDLLARYIQPNHLNKIKTEEDYLRFLKSVLFYQYNRASFEALYINENIMGLINFLSADVLGKKPDEVEKMVPSQNLSALEFHNQKRFARHQNERMYTAKYRIGTNGRTLADQNWAHYVHGRGEMKPFDSYHHADVGTNDTYLREEALQELMNYMISSYKSGGIFNRKKPIFKILFQKHLRSNGNIKELQYYDLFYTFSNMSLFMDTVSGKQDMSCNNQLKLLQATGSFLESMD